MHKAYAYVECWEEMKAGNIGYLLWGMAGTGKSYFAGCIANALMEKEVSVCMTNFALILNDLAASCKDRNEYIARLCRNRWTSADGTQWKNCSAVPMRLIFGRRYRFVIRNM